MKKTLAAIISAVSVAASAAPVVAHADSISGIEGARAKDRQGRYLTRHDREQLRRYGSSDDYGWRGYRGYGYYDDYYDGGSGVGVYVGPGGVGIYGY